MKAHTLTLAGGTFGQWAEHAGGGRPLHGAAGRGHGQLRDPWDTS